jgi:TolA-binding protein
MTEPLEELVGALRETTSGEELAAGRYTRSRVLRAVHLQKRKRVLNLAFGLPIAAILIGSGAWAASGQHLPVIVERVSIALGIREREVTVERRPVRGSRAMEKPIPSTAAAKAADVVAPAASSHATTEPFGLAQRSPIVNSASSLALPQVRPQASVPHDSRVTEQELSLYENAHRAHFIEKDSTTALRAWDEYLTQVPRGRFVLEARYNRALCLLRLGRNQEAVSALSLFAQGRFGNYRKAEAQSLIDGLSAEEN